MKKLSISLLILMPGILSAQGVMTPELLWSLGRVNALSQTPDGQSILYAVAKTNIKTEKSATEYYLADITSGNTSKFTALKGYDFVQWNNNGLYATKDSALMKSADNGAAWSLVNDKMKDVTNIRISPDGKWIAFSKDIDGEKVLGKDIYPDASKSTAQIYTDLNYRHWDKWNFGKLSHVFVMPADGSAVPKDIMQGQPYDCPQKPFGGAEDFIFSPDSKSVLYVCKKKVGKEYAQSTNTDIYNYDIASGNTANITEGMPGYDVAPQFSHDGKKLAWLSMKTDGYESDKNDIVVMDWANKQKMNLTAGWDETVDGGFAWSNDDKNIYFNASIKGTDQLFSVMVPANLMARIMPVVQQETKGDFDITGIAAQYKNTLVVTRTDFNHATELYKLDLKNTDMLQLSHANDSAYNKIKMSKSELRMVTTTDGKQMGVWVIYPPDFDAAKKYPTLLYCQGGPQSAVTQFYSVRWNFQLMAANGYIIVAPNRRGMPGWGVQWNAAISKDWGGQPMQDYLAAIDAVAKEPYVDKNRLGCVGASYGGYSVYMLAGIHNNRFKTFIAHDGLFDMKSWYGTTEELWFANWDLGGNYWQNSSPESYTRFNPSNYIDKWNTPIMIIQGGIDFRVPIEQGFEAFQAAQLKGIKSKILYFPNENHWVLHCHNGLVWQRAFFDWLKETL